MKGVKSPSTILLGLSVVTLIVTIYASFTQTDVFGLAGTQLMEISILLAVYGVYVQSCNCNTGKTE